MDKMNSHVLDFYSHREWLARGLGRQLTQLYYYTKYQIEVTPEWNSYETNNNNK